MDNPLFVKMKTIKNYAEWISNAAAFASGETSLTKF
jgi:hypothetical protein